VSQQVVVVPVNVVNVRGGFEIFVYFLASEEFASHLQLVQVKQLRVRLFYCVQFLSV